MEYAKDVKKKTKKHSKVRVGSVCKSMTHPNIILLCGSSIRGRKNIFKHYNMTLHTYFLKAIYCEEFYRKIGNFEDLWSPVGSLKEL